MNIGVTPGLSTVHIKHILHKVAFDLPLFILNVKNASFLAIFKGLRLMCQDIISPIISPNYCAIPNNQVAMKQACTRLYW